MTDRIETMKTLLAKKPDDARLLFGLALEYEKHGMWTDAVEAFRAYLDRSDDEGNAWGRLAHSLRMLDRDDEAREAYARGIAVSRAHGHPSMAAEFEDILSDWD